MFLQRGKILLFLFPASRQTSCIDAVYENSTVPTHFLLNFAVFAIHSTAEKSFCFRCWFQNTDPCAEAAFSFTMEEKSLRSLQSQHLLILCLLEKARVYTCTCRFQASPGHCTENQLCSLQHLVPQHKELLHWGQPGVKTPLVAQDLISWAWGCQINSLFFSHTLAKMNCEDGPTSSSLTPYKIFSSTNNF